MGYVNHDVRMEYFHVPDGLVKDIEWQIKLWQNRIDTNCVQEHNQIYRPKKEYERRITKHIEYMDKHFPNWLDSIESYGLALAQKATRVLIQMG